MAIFDNIGTWTAWQLPSTGTSEAGADTAWTNPGNITANDDSDATCVGITKSTQSNILRASGFSFGLPAGTEPYAIRVRIRRHDNFASITINDLSVTLNIAGASGSSDDNADAATNWPTDEAIAQYRGSPEAGYIWGLYKVSLADIDNLQVDLLVDGSGLSGSETAHVDAIEVGVYYGAPLYHDKQYDTGPVAISGNTGWGTGSVYGTSGGGDAFATRPSVTTGYENLPALGSDTYRGVFTAATTGIVRNGTDIGEGLIQAFLVDIDGTPDTVSQRLPGANSYRFSSDMWSLGLAHAAGLRVWGGEDSLQIRPFVKNLQTDAATADADMDAVNGQYRSFKSVLLPQADSHNAYFKVSSAAVTLASITSTAKAYATLTTASRYPSADVTPTPTRLGSDVFAQAGTNKVEVTLKETGLYLVSLSLRLDQTGSPSGLSGYAFGAEYGGVDITMAEGRISIDPLWSDANEAFGSSAFLVDVATANLALKFWAQKITAASDNADIADVECSIYRTVAGNEKWIDVETAAADISATSDTNIQLTTQNHIDSDYFSHSTGGSTSERITMEREHEAYLFFERAEYDQEVGNGPPIEFHADFGTTGASPWKIGGSSRADKYSVDNPQTVNHIVYPIASGTDGAGGGYKLSFRAINHGTDPGTLNAGVRVQGISIARLYDIPFSTFEDSLILSHGAALAKAPWLTMLDGVGFTQAGGVSGGARLIVDHTATVSMVPGYQPTDQYTYTTSSIFALQADMASTGGFLYEDAAIIAGAYALASLAGISRDHSLSLALAGAQAADPLLNFRATLTLLLQGGQSINNQAGLAAEITMPLQALGAAAQHLNMPAQAVLGHLGTAAATSQIDMAALASLAHSYGLSPANIILLQAALSVGCDQAVASANDIKLPMAVALSIDGEATSGNDIAFNTLASINHQPNTQTSRTLTLSLVADLGATQALGALTQADLAAQATFAGDLASLITDTLNKRASTRRTLKVPGGARTLTLTKR